MSHWMINATPLRETAYRIVELHDIEPFDITLDEEHDRITLRLEDLRTILAAFDRTLPTIDEVCGILGAAQYERTFAKDLHVKARMVGYADWRGSGIHHGTLHTDTGKWLLVEWGHLNGPSALNAEQWEIAADDIEPDPDGWRRARGVAPMAPGAPSAEEAIRRGRDDE